MEGQILDDTYRIVRLVAEGGMGLVYEATHARLSGRYAIKVLPAKWSKDPEAMARFDREARITSSLQHPNIVQIIDFNTAVDGTEYLVMEYLRGETLAARLARVGPMPLEAVASVIEQIAAGLAAAHAHGIVHRDLKPDNVFLMQVEGRDGEWAKILDFGISKASDASLGTLDTVNKTLIGTPQYMAPEQCEGRNADVGPAADQFALAAMTYEMLTGNRPFAGETLGEVLFRVLHADPPPMHVDPAIESVVRRGLAKSSRRRYPSVTAFAEALRAVARAHATQAGGLEVSGSHGYAVGEMERTRRERPPRRRHPAAAVAAVAVVILGTAFVVGTARTKPAAMPADIAGRTAATVAVPAPVLAVPTRPPARTEAAEAEPSTAPSAGLEVASAPEASDSRMDGNDAAMVVPLSAREETRGPTERAVASAPRARAVSRTPGLLTPAWAARTPSARPPTTTTASRARPTPTRIADRRTWLAPRRSSESTAAYAGSAAGYEPPPFVPAPVVDDDAVLPLDENFNDRR